MKPQLTRRQSRYVRKSKDKSPMILRGLKSEMPATQALLMIALFNQCITFFNKFPSQFFKNKDLFFPANKIEIFRQLHLDLISFTELINNLVGLGFLDKRNASGGGMEYRIVFDRLRKYL